MRLRWAIFALVLLSSGAHAEPGPSVRAVLVGVSDYLYLDADLKGPRNDVRLMRETLVSRGVAADQITVLSQDGTVPTRAAILGSLDHLAAISGPGDQVLFYFSGHGTQAPDLSGDEMGGYDEIFLPADAKGWSDSSRSVENAVVDDEFQAKAAAITATGAGLVVILDACHAATGFRVPGSGR
ncbi:MAG: putative caspase-like protein [Paracoccaceae bacterium]